MQKEFSKKIILITGCSSGFGLCMSMRLASQGHTVISTMRNLSKKEPLLKKLKELNAAVDLQKLDVTDKSTIQKIMDHIKNTYGKLDILINNAGYGIGGAFEDLTDQEIRDQLETNFFGVMNVTRKALPLMRGVKGAKIINISSVASFSASPCFCAYNTSKWALEAFSECLRYELSLFDIDVLTVQPGMYKTEIFGSNAKVAKHFNDPNSLYYPLSQFLKEKVEQNVAKLKKDPKDIALLVEKLILAKNPPFRNLTDVEGRFHYFMRKILPFKVYNWIVYKMTLSKVKERMGAK